MNAEWLIIRPVFDEVTEITFDEAQDFINFLKEKGTSHIDLAKEEAILENVEEVLVENPTISIYHANHGSEDKIWGNDGRPVIDLNNVHLLEGKEIFNNNCSSAKKLGVEAWKKGCKAFFGYTDVFMFTTDALEEFKIAVTYGPKRRVDGLSLKECLETTKEKMTELRDKLIKAGKALAAACMTKDRDILVCYNTEPPTSDCPVRRLAVRAFGPKIGWKLTKKFTISIALIVLLLLIACQFHDVGGHQMDMMFWDVCPPEKQSEYWIPEFNITYRNAFIMFWLMNYTGFALVVMLLALCLAYTVYVHLSLSMVKYCPDCGEPLFHVPWLRK